MLLLGTCKDCQGRHSVKSISSGNTHKGKQTVRCVYLGTSTMDNYGSRAAGQSFSMAFLVVGM